MFSLHHHVWRWGAGAMLVSLIALVTPVASAQQASSIEISIDTPSAGAVVASGQPLTVGGWAVDTSAVFGSGIDAVVVSIDGPATTGASGVAAQYGTSRPDVAQQLGRSAWGNSGFTLTWAPQGLTPGPHTLVVSAHATRGVWSSSTVALVVQGGAPFAALPAPQLPLPPPAPAGPAVPRALPPPPPCAISAYDTALPICR